MKYLTIDDYNTPDEAISKCLKALLGIYRTFDGEVDLARQDKKHAIYLLLGSAIDAAHVAYQQWGAGWIAPTLHIHRYIIEVAALAEMFLVSDLETQRWFEGGFVSGRLTQRTKEKLKEIVPKKAIIPFHFPEETALYEAEKTRQETFEFLSKFCHPTIDAIRLGFSQTDKALGRHSSMQDYAFGRDFLGNLILLVNDIGRCVFVGSSKANEVMYLMLSEYRVLFSAKAF